MNTCKHWLCLFAFLMVATLSAQTITGTVIDGELKEPLLGANVLIKGTSHGTSTDENGKFTLKTTQKKGTLLLGLKLRMSLSPLSKERLLFRLHFFLMLKNSQELQ